MATTKADPSISVDDQLIESVIADLRHHGASRTGPRRAVITVLVRAHMHLSADDVAVAVRDAGERAHRSTVYRTLNQLVRQQALTRCVFGDGVARFYVTEQCASHVHLHCEECGRDTEAPASLLVTFEHAAYRKYGFVVRPGQFSQVGVCSLCIAEPSGADSHLHTVC